MYVNNRGQRGRYLSIGDHRESRLSGRSLCHSTCSSWVVGIERLVTTTLTSQSHLLMRERERGREEDGREEGRQEGEERGQEGGGRKEEVQEWFTEQGISDLIKPNVSSCTDIKLTLVQVNRHFRRCCGRGQYAEVLWYEGSGRGRQAELDLICTPECHKSMINIYHLYEWAGQTLAMAT